MRWSGHAEAVETESVGARGQHTVESCAEVGLGTAVGLMKDNACVRGQWALLRQLDLVGRCAKEGIGKFIRKADDVFGLRLNVWTSIVVFTLAVTYFIWSSRRRPGREESVLREERTTVEA